MTIKEMPRQYMWKCYVVGTSSKWCELQRNVRSLRSGLDREGFDGKVGSELGVEGYIGFGYTGWQRRHFKKESSDV